MSIRFYCNNKKNIASAIRYLERSLAIAKKYDISLVIVEASESLMKLYADQKNYEKAFANMLINNKINDSLASGENIKRIRITL